ncbi:MAG: GNAT family N-acetyltransferase [Clostridia bacterium]|nr:GNAT family N-acetyltransferase [Clostridia bacterium]
MDLHIRRMVPGDLEELFALLSDPCVMEHMEAPYTREQAKDFLETAGLTDPPRIYAAEDEGQFLGYVIFHPWDKESMELGWVLRREAWGRGYATMITKLAQAKAREMEKDLIIECVPSQAVTGHIAEKCGFAFEGEIDDLLVYRWRP